MDKDMENAIAGLVKAGELQQKNISDLNDNMVVLVQALRMRPTRRQTFGIAGALNLFTILIVAVMMVVVVNSSRDTKRIVSIAVGCLTPGPNHDCYNQIQANNDLNRKVISLRSEQLRLKSQIVVAEANENATSVEQLNKLLDGINVQLQEAGQTP